jgi:hypothetical protein
MANYYIFCSLTRRPVYRGIFSYIQSFDKYSDKELIDTYNNQIDIGITGVHRQALFLYALDYVYKKRFRKSRILQRGAIIDLKWKAEIVNGRIKFRKKKVPKPSRKVRRNLDSLAKPQPRVYYTCKKKLKISFRTLVIRVESITKYFGRLDDFAEQNDLHGVSNKRLFIRSEMRGSYPSEFFKEKVDYVFVQEQLISGVKGSIDPLSNQPIPDCEDIPWLDSIILRKGHFIWYQSPF